MILFPKDFIILCFHVENIMKFLACGFVIASGFSRLIIIRRLLRRIGVVESIEGANQNQTVILGFKRAYICRI